MGRLSFHILFLMLIGSKGLAFASSPLIDKTDGQGIHATWGGAEWGDESTLGQQMAYLNQTLPQILEGWEMELISDSLFVDSERDREGQLFYRYNRNAKGEMQFFSYVPRTVKFLVRSPNGKIQQGSIYLIEELGETSDLFLARNLSTEANLRELRFGKALRFSLASSLSPSNFELELDRDSFSFAERDSSFARGASQQQKLSFVVNELGSHLLVRGYELIPESVDIAYYYDYRMHLRFADRDGHLISYIYRDKEGKYFSATLNLWESRSDHIPMVHQKNSSLRRMSEPFSQNTSEIWLARGYKHVDMGLEYDVFGRFPREITLKGLFDQPLSCQDNLLVGVEG